MPKSVIRVKRLFEICLFYRGLKPYYLHGNWRGGSGGALAIGVGDRVMMLQYSIYSVISPEGCASILWKSAEKASEAADAMNLTADKIFRLGLVDGIIPEPLGGAHRHYDVMAQTIKQELLTQLTELQSLPLPTLLEQRYQRIMSYGLNQ